MGVWRQAAAERLKRGCRRAIALQQSPDHLLKPLLVAGRLLLGLRVGGRPLRFWLLPRRWRAAMHLLCRWHAHRRAASAEQGCGEQERFAAASLQRTAGLPAAILVWECDAQAEVSSGSAVQQREAQPMNPTWVPCTAPLALICAWLSGTAISHPKCRHRQQPSYLFCRPHRPLFLHWEDLPPG